MGTMRLDTFVDAPPGRVFDMTTDFRSAHERVSGIDKIEMLTEGPVGVGTRFRETRTMFGKEAVEEMEVVSFDPGSRYTLGCDSCGSRFETVVSCTPEGAGTRLAMDMAWTPKTFGAKLMTPLGFMMKGMMRKCIEQDLADIKKSAEAGAGTPA